MLIERSECANRELSVNRESESRNRGVEIELRELFEEALIAFN